MQSMLINNFFYKLKPAIPRWFQIFLRRQMALYQRKKYTHIWPIDPAAGTPPKGWQGWPDKRKFALVITHDADTQRGHDRCYKLMEIEEGLGFRSVFNFVPERYNVSENLRNDLIKRGFEVGVHGLNHDGRLFSNREVFNERAIKINQYLKDWGAVGFRSPAMHHNLDWIHYLNIEYDASTFDTDPFEPQSDGVGTIFPFWVRDKTTQNGYIEIPYTLCQDFTLFIILKENGIDIWKKKLDWIVEKRGMALINIHPDYIQFSEERASPELYPVELYIKFLEYVKSRYDGQYWQVLAKDLANYYITHFKGRL